MNGSFSDKTTAIKKCHCVISTSKLVVLNIQFFTEPVENCGSELRVTKTNGSAISMVCQSSGSISLDDEQVYVVLTKQPSPQNTTFSIQITLGNENVYIQATCSDSSDEITTSIFTTNVTQNTKDNASTITQLKNLETSALTTENIQSSSTPFSSLSSTNVNFESFVTGESSVGVIAATVIGWGLALAFGITTFVLFCKQIRQIKDKSNSNSRYEDLHVPQDTSTYSSTDRSQNYEDVSSDTV